MIRVLEQARLLPLPTINAHYHEMHTPPPSKKETSKTNSITKYFKKEEGEGERK